MNDYSDLLFLIGAMVVFAMLSINASNIFRINNSGLVLAEVEYNAIALAQDEIDEVRWLPDEEIDQLDPGDPAYRYANTVTKTVEIDDQEIDYQLSGTSTPITFSDLDITSFKVKVTVNSQYLPGQEITQTTIKSFPETP